MGCVDVPGLASILLTMIQFVRAHRKRIAAAAITVALVFSGFLWWNAVPGDLTDDDRLAIAPIIESSPLLNSFESEVAEISQIQRAVMEIAPKHSAIPLGQSREPADLFRNGGGFCYDRSRTIEKCLRATGFETRRVFIVYLDGKSAISALASPGHPTHAVAEVKTSKGWMVVDSVDPWFGLGCVRKTKF